MIENINQSKLQEVIDSMVGQDASIGVHGISIYHADHTDEKNNPKDILISIMSDGLRMSNIHKGLTGTLRFLDKENCASDILEYSAYQSVDENNIIYRIICAIPEVMEDKNGKKYYLGKYDKVSQLGKDNYKVQYLPTHDLTVLPKEFIVGFLAQNSNTNKATFVANKNYYNIQREETKRNFEDAFLQKIKSNGNLLPFDEESYEKVTSLCDVYSKFGREIPNEYYVRSFLESYNKHGKTK